MNRGITAFVALLVATSAVGTAFGAAASPSTTDAESSTSTASETETTTATAAGGEAYAGSHVAFDVEGDAITDYRVGGEETFSSVAVQSTGEVDAGIGARIDLETMTSLEGAGLSLAAQSETGAELTAESGATLSAHDTERGTLVVESGEDGQYVTAELAANATAENEGDDGDRVCVETDDHEGVFLVVGDGEVTVNDEGDVAAELGENATLAFRSYEDGERDESAEYEESLIADGKSAVGVHVESRDGEQVGEAVTYGQETSAEVATEARNRVDVTIDRAIHTGTVVVTTVSEEAVGSLEDLEVRIDGEAAAEVSSKSELEGAIGSDQSRYMVENTAEASAEATVYIAVNHFSERTATIDGDETNDSDGTNDGSDTDDGTQTNESDETDGTDDTSDSDGTDETDGTNADGDAESGDENDATDDGDEETTDGADDSEDDAGDGMPGFGVTATLIAALVGISASVRR